MTTFADPVFSADYQGLCTKIADTLNRQDLLTAIPDFTVLASARISRDMARLKHPSSMSRATATADGEYIPKPSDFVAPFQMSLTDSGQYLEYLSPEQVKEVLSEGWSTTAPKTTNAAPGTPPVYYTIIGPQIRIMPAPNASATVSLDLWYFAHLQALNTANTTNWVLTQYPDLYLYAALVHSAPYLKGDARLQVWETIYQTILADIAVEADRAWRPVSKLSAARRSF